MHNTERNPFAFEGDEVIAAKSGAAPESAYRSPANAMHVNSHGHDYSMSVCQVHSSAIAPMRIDMPWMPSAAKNGRGSGFAIEGDFLVTNHHVIADAGLIEVTFPRTGAGKKYRAHVVIDCPSKDIAILKLDDAAIKLSPMKILNCDSMPQGEEVYAVGFPLGQPHLKVTQGVFAGSERMPGGSNFLQISAPLCPGNSGGPLVYLDGVVGINSAIIPGQNCVGYSIPSTQLCSVLHDYKYERRKKSPSPASATHLLRRPMLGAIWQASDANQNAYLGNPNEEGGVYVNYVMPGSLLHEAGLRRGTEVQSVSICGGAAIPVNMAGEMSVEWSKTPVHITDVLGRLQEGNRVALQVFKPGRAPQKLKFTYTNTRDPRAVKQVFTPYESIDWELVGGLVCANLTVNHIQAYMNQNPTLARYLDPSNLYKPAVIISHVAPYSKIANTHHVAPGMRLVALNGDKVNSVQAMRAWFAKQPRDLKYVQFTVKGFCTSDIVLKVGDMVAEMELAKKFRYPTSSIMQALQKTVAGGGGATGALAENSRLGALLDVGGQMLIGPCCDCEGCTCTGRGDCNCKKCGCCDTVGVCNSVTVQCATETVGDDHLSLDSVRQIMGWAHMNDDEVTAALAVTS